MTGGRDNAKKRVGGRLDGEIVGTGTVVKGGERGSGGKGRGGKGGSEEGRREGKAVRRTLGEIMLERKLQLARLRGGGKGAGSAGPGSRQGRLQVKNQPDRGNRVVADGQRGDLPAPRTTPQPDGRTRHRDGRTHDNDDDDDDDNVSLPKRGSPGRMRISSVVPRTNFSCPDEAKGEYFADRETGCQVRKCKEYKVRAVAGSKTGCNAGSDVSLSFFLKKKSCVKEYSKIVGAVHDPSMCMFCV